MVNEIATTHRVYRKEWIHVGTYDDRESALENLNVEYHGRLREEDMRVSGEERAITTAYVRTWNVVAEFKRQGIAEAWMEALVQEGNEPADLMTVARNSRAEINLQNYGVLKLLTG